MDNQSINVTLTFGFMALGAGAVVTYFSPIMLRHLSAWAESRAAAIDYQAKIKRKMLQRLGITSIPYTSSSRPVVTLQVARELDRPSVS